MEDDDKSGSQDNFQNETVQLMYRQMAVMPPIPEEKLNQNLIKIKYIVLDN